MQNIRNFFIAFGVSLVVFSLIAFAILGNFDSSGENNELVNNNDDKNKENVEVFVPVNSDEIKGESFTALLGCKDDLTGRLDALMLLSVDKENKQYMLSSLPSYMVLNIDTIDYYLGDILNEKGRNFLLNKVHAITGVKIDYYAFVSLSGFANIIDELGGITFTVPENMYYKDVNGKVLVNLNKGTRHLTGSQALQLMRYRGYNDGEVRRQSVQREFILTTFDSILNINNIAKAPEVFKKLVKNVDTNFTYENLTSNIDLIFSYAAFNKVEVEYPGVLNKTSDDIVRFIPKIDAAIGEFRKYR